METTSKQRILNVAAKLFMEKGFAKTTMQDIVRESGMSKGAIYHYFSTKDEIIQEVLLIQEQMMQTQMSVLEDKTEATAKEKIIQMFTSSATSNASSNISEVLKSSDFILKYMQDNLKQGAPVLSKIIKEGNLDGSFQAKYPDQIAEVFLLLLNIWCDSYIFPSNQIQITQKLQFLQYMMKSLGIDILTDEYIDICKSRK